MNQQEEGVAQTHRLLLGPWWYEFWLNRLGGNFFNNQKGTFLFGTMVVIMYVICRPCLWHNQGPPVYTGIPT